MASYETVSKFVNLLRDHHSDSYALGYIQSMLSSHVPEEEVQRSIDYFINMMMKKNEEVSA